MTKWGLVAVTLIAVVGLTLMPENVWAQSPGDITGDFAEGIGEFVRVLLNIVVDFIGALLTELSCFLQEFFVDNPANCQQRGL